MIIRPAHADDLPAILAIVNHAILHSTALFEYDARSLDDQRAWLAEKRAGNWPVVVADPGDGAIGFASYGPFRSRPAYRHTVEHSVYVAPGQHGRGVGRAMMAALLAQARAEDRHVMVGGIDAGNAGSIAFHARLGFVETGRMLQIGWKFGRWLDLVFMQMILGDA